MECAAIKRTSPVRFGMVAFAAAALLCVSSADARKPGPPNQGRPSVHQASSVLRGRMQGNPVEFDSPFRSDVNSKLGNRDHVVDPGTTGKGQIASAHPDARSLRPPAVLAFNLDWTTYQGHRVHADEPLEILLEGEISANEPVTWQLFDTEGNLQEYPQLVCSNTPFGTVDGGDAYRIPLDWEISIDGRRFHPMKLGPEGCLMVHFSPGMHRFTVRIHGDTDRYQPAGFYQVSLRQQLMPQL